MKKKNERFTNWIQSELHWEENLFEEFVGTRKKCQIILSKVSEIHFYDDTDDEEDEFEMVPPDKNQEEINYISDRLLDEKPIEEKNPKEKNEQNLESYILSKSPKKRQKINIKELEEFDKKAINNFVDTRNSVTSQLSERHAFTSSTDQEPNLDAAMVRSRFNTAKAVFFLEKQTV